MKKTPNPVSFFVSDPIVLSPLLSFEGSIVYSAVVAHPLLELKFCSVEMI